MSVSRRSVLLAGAGAAALGAGPFPAVAAASGTRTRQGPGFVRRDVAKLVDPRTGAWDPALYWYAKAVGWMKKRRPEEWNSWLFQAYTHGKDQPASGDPTEWRQCPHNSPYFLPWHRWYLYWFERIVRHVIVVELRRPEQANWALPYWNYAHVEPGGEEAAAPWRRVPAAFRQKQLPGGHEENPLYLTPGVPTGRCRDEEPLAWDQVSPDKAMRFPHFGWDEADADPRPGFSPALEKWPHGLVHDGVGGLMGKISRSAQDPVFWLHHANIDRMWYAWLSRGHALPPGWEWPEVRPPHKGYEGPGLPFRFRDEKGVQHDLTGPVFAFPRDAYAYDSLDDGTGTGEAAGGAVPLPARPADADVVASADGELRLDDAPSTVRCVARSGREDALESALERGSVVLTVHGVRAEEPPCRVYRLFVGHDTGRAESTDPSGPAFVADLVFFGAVGEQLGVHHGDGHTLRFDVTETLRAVRDAGDWAGGVPDVRIVPGPGRLHRDARPRFSRVTFAVT